MASIFNFKSTKYYWIATAIASYPVVIYTTDASLTAYGLTNVAAGYFAIYVLTLILYSIIIVILQITKNEPSDKAIKNIFLIAWGIGALAILLGNAPGKRDKDAISEKSEIHIEKKK